MFITVADTGEGISDDVKEKLFKPLFTTKSKGQGFGLAVVKKLTEALNGKVTVESQIGKGTQIHRGISNELELMLNLCLWGLNLAYAPSPICLLI